MQASDLSLTGIGLQVRCGCSRCDHHWSVALQIASSDERVVPVALLANALDVLRPYVRLSGGRPRARNRAWDVSHRIVEAMALPAVLQRERAVNRPAANSGAFEQGAA